MATGKRRDPYRAFNFIIEIDGISRGAFSECSGLDSSADAVTYREGTDGRGFRQLPGLTKQANITLKRGVTDDATLWAWHKTVLDGAVERKTGSIVLLDDSGSEKLRWNFVEAWPTKWTGPTLNASGNEVAFESIEIVHEGLVKA